MNRPIVTGKHFLLNNINKINNIETISVDCIDDIQFKNNCLSVFSMNISSLIAHIYELIIYLNSINNRFDVFSFK